MRSASIRSLAAERDEWGRRMAQLAERWVRARAAGVSTTEIDREMANADRHWRRLDRRIRRHR